MQTFRPDDMHHPPSTSKKSRLWANVLSLPRVISIAANLMLLVGLGLHADVLDGAVAPKSGPNFPAILQIFCVTTIRGLPQFSIFVLHIYLRLIGIL